MQSQSGKIAADSNEHILNSTPACNGQHCHTVTMSDCNSNETVQRCHIALELVEYRFSQCVDMVLQLILSCACPLSSHTPFVLVRIIG